MNKILLPILAVACLSGCTLKRDNPLDQYNDGKTASGQPTQKMAYSKHTINNDNNSDGKVNTGESIEIQLYLKNAGTQSVSNVKATLLCTSSYVSNIAPTTPVAYTYNYSNDIPAGKEAIGGFGTNFTFNVASTTPPGTELTFLTTITDDETHTWVDSFKVTVLATTANLSLGKHEIEQDNNSNGQANPGETIYINATVKNTGTSDAMKVKGTISNNTMYVTNLYPTGAAGFTYAYADKIPAGKESDDSFGYTFSFTIASFTPPGTVLTFPVAIKDDCDNVWNDSFTITVY